MIDCEQHGLCFIARCCEHVEAAIEASALLPTTAFMDHFTDVHHLCPDCAAPVAAWLNEYRRGHPVPDEPSFSEQGHCGEHLREWYRAAGGGELSLAVQRARDERYRIEAERAAMLEKSLKLPP